uniref:Uncharacterized protein n=1 Tax=Acrobeloides nanus TaxID=290746 RepID=A0A914EC21_9BILA
MYRVETHMAQAPFPPSNQQRGLELDYGVEGNQFLGYGYNQGFYSPFLGENSQVSAHGEIENPYAYANTFYSGASWETVPDYLNGLPTYAEEYGPLQGEEDEVYPYDADDPVPEKTENSEWDEPQFDEEVESDHVFHVAEMIEGDNTKNEKNDQNQNFYYEQQDGSFHNIASEYLHENNEEAQHQTLSTAVSTHLAAKQNSSLLMTCQKFLQNPENSSKKHLAFIVIDPGSECTYIKKSASKELELHPKSKIILAISTFMNDKPTEP